MESNKNKVDVNHVIPLHLVIKSAGSDLYRIGLSLFPFGSQKRNRIYNPYIIFSINVMFICCMFCKVIKKYLSFVSSLESIVTNS